jgi:hypothetical protein
VQAPRHEEVRGSASIAPPFLISPLIEGDWSASHPGRFTPGEKASGTHFIGGWVGPRTGLYDVENEKSRPYRDSNSDPSVVQPVASRYTNCVSQWKCKMHPASKC